MAKRRVALTHRKQRSVLTDMLPFEVPPTFSNRGFYRFIRDNQVEIEDGCVRWVSNTGDLSAAMKVIFGFKENAAISSTALTEWGKQKTRYSVALSDCVMSTIPFNFSVAHKLDGRTLSVVHPRNQVEIASFYAKHSALIIYYTSLSEFSIRKPVGVAQYVFYKDKLHEQRLEEIRHGVEERDREYEQLGSYFVYEKYRNIHRFFESYKYHRAEKKYNGMIQIDISKCFDSIYTHSLPWAVLGKSQTKFKLHESLATFAGKFDAVMQSLNHSETNGIVIGPEFSRIFAEIILQAVDVELRRRLANTSNLSHRVHYEVFRYVDDYFVFYNEQSTQLKVTETLQEVLRAKKLNVNSGKVRHYQKPIITEITIAKERVTTLLGAAIDPKIDQGVTQDSSAAVPVHLVCDVNANRLIIRYKTIIKESNVEYGDLINYTFAIVENKIDALFKCFSQSDQINTNRKRLLRALLAVAEFAFFAYSASPKVNHTIRLCRMIATSVDFLRKSGMPYEFKHSFFKYVHDNVMQQLDKNTAGMHREIETQYFIICLSQIGKEYWVPESTLAKHFHLDLNNENAYTRKDHLSYFSITVLLSYIKNKFRYNRLREFIQTHVVEKLAFKKSHCPHDAESLFLLLDLAVCPYLNLETKAAIGGVFDLTDLEIKSIQASNDSWFTSWGDKFDLGKELDAKRSREVY